MIIDIHTHNTTPELTPSLLEAAGRNGVQTVIFLGAVLRFGYSPDERQIREINDDTIATVKKYPEECYGFCFANPTHDPDFTLQEIDRCVTGHGFKGVKLEVALNCRSERLEPIMKKLEELEIPLLHHSWYKSVSKYPEESDPSDIAFLGRRFPRVKIVMAHLAGCGYR
ncbi:MAG: amidohydrolase family protein, partial [Victivallaceae bacterium]|nr:amidohydrolase family protein [Victivallaceae bacterium]